MAAKVYMGVDYGHVRIGLALGDSETRLASPLTTLEKTADPVAAVAAEADKHQAAALVVGLPRGLDGQDTVQTEAAKLFASKLRAAGWDVYMQDEAGTSAVAEERLAGKHHDKAAIDREAAAIILQDYMDQL